MASKRPSGDRSRLPVGKPSLSKKGAGGSVKGQWDQCQISGCHRKTFSGLKEKDLSRRFCHLHRPERVDRALVLMNEARALTAPCKSNGKAPPCRLGPLPIFKGSCRSSFMRSCMLPLDLDGFSNDRQLCFTKQTKLEYTFVPTLRWAYFLATRSMSSDCRCRTCSTCRYLPHIKWYKKRVPFVFGVSRAPF